MLSKNHKRLIFLFPFLIASYQAVAQDDGAQPDCTNVSPLECSQRYEEAIKIQSKKAQLEQAQANITSAQANRLKSEQKIAETKAVQEKGKTQALLYDVQTSKGQVAETPTLEASDLDHLLTNSSLEDNPSSPPSTNNIAQVPPSVSVPAATSVTAPEIIIEIIEMRPAGRAAKIRTEGQKVGTWVLAGHDFHSAKVEEINKKSIVLNFDAFGKVTYATSR